MKLITLAKPCLRAPIFFLILLLPVLFGGCAREPESPENGAAVDEFNESFGQVGELLQQYPRYGTAKSAMDKGDWDTAAELLQALLSEADPAAAFANDLGIVNMRRGDNEAALAAFRQAVELDRSYERAWFNLGVLNAKMDRLPDAESAYREAVETNPFYYEAWYNLGLLLYRQQRLVEAEEAFLAISTNTRASRFNRVYYQLGLIAADSGDDSEAVKLYDESLLLDPSHVPSYINKATALMRLGFPSEARDSLGRAAALAPDDHRIPWNVGLAYLAEKNDDRARESFEETIDLEPGYAPAYVNLAAIGIRADQPTVAADYLARAASLDPENPNIPWNRGLIAAKNRDDRAAIGFFKRAITLDPDNADAHLNMAATYIRLGELEQARASIANAAELNPEDFRIFWNRGLIALRENMPEQAREDFEKVVRLAPDYAPALFNLGLSAYRDSRWKEARQYFHRAAYNSSGLPYPEANYMLGKTHSEEGNHNAAINEYEIALKLKPEYTEAAYNLALNRQQAGDEAGAIQLYRKLAESSDAPAEALNNLAAWHLGNDRPIEAVPLLKRAVSADPQYATAHYNLGLAHLRNDTFKEAAESFRQTVNLAPDNFAAWKNLGISHARMEEFEIALEAMQEAFRLNPSDADTAVYVVKYLKLLGKPENSITEVYRRAFDTGARNPLMLRHLARDAFDREDYAAATRYYGEYVAIRPTPEYIYNLGLAHFRNDEIDKAIGYFEQATRLDPGNFAFWKNLGIAHSQLEDYEAALDAMREAFRLNPADADSAVYVVKYLKLLDKPETSVSDVYRQAYESGARNVLMLRHLAREAFDRESYDEAAVYYADYVALRPTAPYFYNLGLALRRAGRFAEARLAYEQAVDTRPSYKKAWLNLGYIHAFLGDFPAARNAFEAALRIDPDYANAEAALDELNNGTIKP